MDVIAMRKTSGTITGEICLNGFPQERRSFLRVSGYVEQFDIQQPELTVRETVEFCARLRLNGNDPGIKNTEGKLKYAAHVLAMMELTNIQNLQVGSYEEGGLTFEQRKRLAIACELAGRLRDFGLFPAMNANSVVLRRFCWSIGSPSGKPSHARVSGQQFTRSNSPCV